MMDVWTSIAQDNGWPDPILLKDLNAKKTPGFPYSGGFFRNLCCGQNADPELCEKIFHVGRLAAIRRAGLVRWLDGRTRGRADA